MAFINKQDEFLDRAEAEKWSVVALRRAVKDHRRRIERKQLSLDAAALGKFLVLYADPPWEYSNSGFEGSAKDHYPTMPTDEICAIDVPGLTMDDAVLFLWATNPLLRDALASHAISSNVRAGPPQRVSCLLAFSVRC